MKTSQIAINAVSTRHKTLEDALQAYSAAGFRLVEFPLGQIKQWLKASPDRTVQDAKALLGKFGLTSIGGFEAGLVCFGSAEDKKKNFELLVGNGKLIADLGGGTMIIGTDGDDKNNLDTLKAIGKQVRELALAIPPSVKLGVEFNWSPVVKSVRSAMIVTEEACHGRVGILFDPAHYHCTPSKFEDLTERVVKHIVHVHVDDMLDKPGDRSNCNADRVLPGEGIIDLPRIFGLFDELGYDGAYSIEMFNDDLWAMDVNEAARRCYAAMARLTCCGHCHG